MKNTVYLVIITIVFISCAPKHQGVMPYTVTAPLTLKDSSFIKKYKRIVFGNTDAKTPNNSKLINWAAPIYIYFDKTVPEKHSEQLMSFAEDLSKDIDSLSISRVWDKSASNYLVYYLNDDNSIDYQPKIKSKYVGGYIKWGSDCIIDNGYLRVDTRNKMPKQMLLLHAKVHFYRSLGYFQTIDDETHVIDYLNSAFANKKVLSQFDKDVVKYHYSVNVGRGMTKKMFETIQNMKTNVLEKHPKTKIKIRHEYDDN